MSVAFELSLALVGDLFSTKASDSKSVVLTVGLTASKIAGIRFQNWDKICPVGSLAIESLLKK